MPGKNRKYSLGKKSNSVELTLPTGDVCRVRRPGVAGLVKVGVLDSLDTLTAMMERAEGGPTKMPSKEDLLTALDVVDRVVAYCVIEPEVVRPVRRVDGPDGEHFVPLEDDERDPDVLYTDEVDEENRFFILNFVVGGSSDLEAFRQGFAESMGDVGSVQGVPMPTE